MSYNPYSYTSNTVKLLKHLDALGNLQCGIVNPVMLHVMPTHRCQLNCVHCCFKNRTDKQLDLKYETLIEAVGQLACMGLKSVEITGGGEPTLYPWINEFIEFCHLNLLPVGMITNGININNITDRNLSRLAWIRVSLNTLDYRNGLDLESVRELPYSFCYIWNKTSDINISKVKQFAEYHKKPCRISPDCIQPIGNIAADMQTIRRIMPQSDYLFLSDFNTTLHRRNNNCYMHAIKPALYTDGYLYPCPSAELAIENNKQINTGFRLCRAEDTREFYQGDPQMPLRHNCSYCKYTLQNNLIEDVLTETEFNDFL